MPPRPGFFRLLCMLFLAVVLIPGCRSYGPVYLSGAAEFSLLSPEHIEKNIDMFQRISGVYQERSFELSAWVRADGTGIMMELLNDMGSSLGELVFTDRELRFTSSYFPGKLPAEYAVADFQLCFYRVPALRGALGGLWLETETGGSLERRLVYEGDALIIEIEKGPGSLRYTNYRRAYSYTILGNFL
ncbi:MAG: DUF3261 domain-containing protein [Spirochaetaceae bacterium]|jgi:hypothetical protein|nr:DUF3261 domain-containing protein [Spirochaetaceae bacterium]